MSLREEFELREGSFIAPGGCLSAETRGRRRAEDSCPIRTEFQIDRDRIVYSNSFRRLKYKTQVFLSPLGDHYRTRLTHTLEVAQMAKDITRAMRLNEDLAEAIALGHDLGHTPFGHSGETALKEIYSENFTHSKQSLRVVDTLEKRGRGLNLTYEVRDGILKHSKGYGNIIPERPGEIAVTVEGRIVRVADVMAYLNHDLDDAIRSGVITRSQVPSSCTRGLGETHSQRAMVMIRDLVFSSRSEGGNVQLHLSPEVHDAMITLRRFLYDNVYRSEQVHNEFVKSKKILSELYGYFLDRGNRAELSAELEGMEMASGDYGEKPIERVVCDFIASITDRYALDLYTKLFFPSPQV